MDARQLSAALAMAATLGLSSVVSASPPIETVPDSVRAGAPQALPGDSAAENPLEPTDMHVLLSSIDVTVSLLDVYGQCRDDDLEHEPCMAMIRSTLGHARTLLGSETQ